MSDSKLGAGAYPAVRMRRMRADEFSRRLMREHRLSTDDLIQPLFVREGVGESEPVPSMPGVERLTVDRLVEKARDLFELGVPAVALFPVIPVEQKSDAAVEAWESNTVYRVRDPDDLML